MEKKHPFHAVTSGLLVQAGLNTEMDLAIVGEIRALLSVLSASEMPVREAHEIAKIHSILPGILRQARQNLLANYAESVLEDLRNRRDEPKKVISTFGPF